MNGSERFSIFMRSTLLRFYETSVELDKNADA